MKIGILGTGIVAQTLGRKLVDIGNEVIFGTRDVDQTMSRTDPDAMGNPPFSEWQSRTRGINLGTFEAAAAHGELVINATAGVASLIALELAGKNNLNGKILIDAANPLDFSAGFPPSLCVCNTDSLGEQIQRRFPKARVVKTLNTVNALLMVNPAAVPGDHNLFMSGNDIAAKAEVGDNLEHWFGWKPDNIIDLGDITSSRASEMQFVMWARLFEVVGHPLFNFQIVAADSHGE